VSGPNKAAVQDALKNLRKEIDGGITKAGSGSYTVRRCCEDWLSGGLPGRDATTVAKNRYVLAPVLATIGTVRLRDLDVTDVDNALAAVAATRSSATVAMAHLALTRAITRAQAKNLVLRNVSALTGTPPGREGRPSRSMTLAQATALAASPATAPTSAAFARPQAPQARSSTYSALSERASSPLPWPRSRHASEAFVAPRAMRRLSAMTRQSRARTLAVAARVALARVQAAHPTWTRGANAPDQGLAAGR
jgi:hypothetical protein